ncbi:MAG: hypothetical protein RMI30_03370 [Thermodesulfovibrio sp.]|nr:hypothetical protein [Thermodesulfovibrio sp.]MDW7998477.1 hypothetical protein [Thermodesulfovibrio sp.]
MKTYEITIKPLSGFGTPLKGDTIFGHICWQAFYDEKIFGMKIEELLNEYEKNPFLVTSTAYLKVGNGYTLKRPEMPVDLLFKVEKYDEREVIRQRKELKKKKWMFLQKNTSLMSLRSEDLYLNDEELLNKLLEYSDLETKRYISKKSISSVIIDFTQPHNSINRLTGTTGEGQFAPYGVEQKVYIPEIELVIFVALREDISIDSVKEALNRIGKSGFGKDASTGLGRFEILSYSEIDLKSIGSDNPNALYTLSPCVLKDFSIKDVFFSPFIRFGRHGDVFAKSGKPFKNPIIMADEAAVIILKDKNIFTKPYIGSSIRGISKIEPKTVTQGYSLYIPVKVEE